jgi:hypothetical protein
LDAAATTAQRRLDLLAPLAHQVEMAWEYSDALHMAPMVSIAAGDLETARRYACQRSQLPLYRETPHLAIEWMLTSAALAGDFHEAVALAQRFRRGWTDADRPSIAAIAFAPAAAAMVYGIRGDDEARREWLGILTDMRRAASVLEDSTAYMQVFDGLVALHRGELGDALARLARAPEWFRHWHNSAWRQWYAAVWAEAAVLAELADRRRRIERAKLIVGHNPIASAIIDRAAAIDADDTEMLLAAADALSTAGCRYQQARTLIFAGGAARVEGEAIMASIGAAPMTT